MKKTLSKVLVAAAVAAVPALSMHAEVKLGANCLMSSVGYGMYSMNASSSINFTKMAETEPFFGGAVYVNGKYYGTTYDYEYVGGEATLTEVTWYTYDPITWQIESKVSCPLDFTYIATDRTYDPTSGKVYSLVYDKTASSVWLATTNLQTGASTMIAPVDNNVFTIACNSKGQLYGINVNAKLYTIDPATGATTLVGPTDVMEDWESDYQQSMTFDYETDKLYWAEFHAPSYFTSSSTLYEVNTATGKATKLADIPGDPELTGLYVMPSLPAGSPGVATKLSATTQSVGSTSVKFSFKAPVNDVDGNALAANSSITFELMIDNDLVDIADLLPGASYTSDYFTVAQGRHSFKVTGTNDKGTGETAAVFFFSGYDAPAAPKSVSATSDGITATITWEAPEAGASALGGPVRTPYTYNVYRYPGAVKVASGVSGLTATDTPGNPALYHYEVTAVSQDGKGPAAQSNSLVIARYDTPYYCGFDTEDEFNLYTVVDITSGGKVWNYDEDRACLRHPWSLYDPIDDYIVSPALTLDASKSYRLSFDAWQMVAGYDEHVMLYYGTTPDVNSMTFVLDTERLNEASTNYSGVVAPLKDGVHYFAFRSKTGTNGFMSYVDNFRVVESGMATVPDAVTGLSALAADGGKLEVIIDFTAPSTNLQGQQLSGLNSIDIYRGESNEPIKTFANPTPGESYTWTDTSVKTGSYTYRVSATNANGTSQEVSAKVYVGVDVPNPVRNLAFEYEDGEGTLSWDAPADGVNGGNLTGVVSYEVARYVNDTPEVIASNYTETTFTDTWQTPVQAYVYYTVTAVTSAGRSQAVATNGYSAGDPYQLPFIESFAGGVAANQPWTVEQVGGPEGIWDIVGNGEYPWANAQDGDRGMATFDGYHTWAKNADMRLISPAITTQHFKDILLTFHIYHYNGVDSWSGESEPVEETLSIEVSVDGGAFQKVAGADFATYSPKNGWEEHTVSLDAFKGQKSIRFAVRAKSAGCFNVHVDNFKVDGVTSVDNVALDGAQLTVHANEAVFSGLTAPLHIFNASGMKVAEARQADGTVVLAPGIYVATSGANTWKFVIK